MNCYVCVLTSDQSTALILCLEYLLTHQSLCRCLSSFTAFLKYTLFFSHSSESRKETTVMLYLTSKIIWHDYTVQPFNPWWWLGGWSRGPDWSCWSQRLVPKGTVQPKSCFNLDFNIFKYWIKEGFTFWLLTFKSLMFCQTLLICEVLLLFAFTLSSMGSCNPVSEVLHLDIWLVFHWKEADVLISPVALTTLSRELLYFDIKANSVTPANLTFPTFTIGAYVLWPIQLHPRLISGIQGSDLWQAD